MRTQKTQSNYKQKFCGAFIKHPQGDATPRRAAGGLNIHASGGQGGFFEKAAPLDPPKNFLKPFGQVIVALLLLFAFFLVGSPLFAKTQKEEQSVSHILGKNKVTVVPDTMLRGFDPITVFFPGNKGPANGGPLDQPGDLIRITPAHPGEYKWLDSKTLQFLPTTHWPALERYTISIEGKEFKISTLMAPPTELDPINGASDLEPLKEINLSLANRIDLKKLAMMVTFEITPLPGVTKDKSYWLTAKDFVVKEMERAAILDDVRYRITLHKPLPYGMRIVMHLRLSLNSNIPGSLINYTFSTKPLFRFTGISSEFTVYPVASEGSVYPVEQAMDCGSGRGQLNLLFCDAPGTVSIEQIKQMVRFSPAVKNLTHEVQGRTIHLRFDADREKAYQLSLKYVPLLSDSRRELAPFGPTSVYFFFRRSGAYLKWLNSKGIIERYGPQVFPMEGRNMDQVDLRIYKINPLDRNFWPFPDDAVEVDDSDRPKGPGEEPQYTTNLREQIKQHGSPLVSKVVPLPLKTGAGRTRFGIQLDSHLARISGTNAPGTYLVGYRPIGESTKRKYVRIQVTDLCLSTVEEESAVNFVVTSLKSGRPIAGATIEVEAVNAKGKWITIISGTTSGNGSYRYSHKEKIEARISRISVKHNKDMLVLDPQNPPPNFMNNHWYRSYGRWLGWLESNPQNSKSKSYEKAHILTERPIYRPEEAVHIKGYIRYRRQGNILPIRKGALTIRVEGPGGKQWKYKVKVTKNGSFYCKFDEKDLPTGEYTASIYQSDFQASVTFKKESYRIPRFEVNITGPDRVALDQPFQLNMNAGYYAGGPVVGQSVQWRVTQEPYHYRYLNYPGFLFSSDERFSGRRPQGHYGTISKSDISDDNGSSFIKIDPTLEDDNRSRKYVAEVTVRGADEQTVTTTHSVLALSPFTLGIKLERFLSNKMEIKPQIIIVGIDGKPIAGKKYHLRLSQRQWHSHLQESDFTTGKAKYVTDVVDETIFQEDYVSEEGIAALSFPVNESGVYVVEISARDKQGRLQKVTADLYVAGKTPVAWKKPKANVFETTADKHSYIPGETAAVILKSPFQQGMALAVVEGPSANTYHWVEVKQGQAVFRMKISGDMTPRVPVHFLLMRGRLPGKNNRMLSGRNDRAKPIAMGNTVWIQVKPKDNQLNINLDHKKKSLPGSNLAVKIKMTDPNGEPLSGEVTLWLVDRAVLALGKEKRLDPLPSFIDPVYSMLRIRDTRNQVVGNLSPEEVAGGDGTERSEAASIFDQVTVRKNFKTVPYFNPAIAVVNGEAEVEIQLPDNLTDFAVRAVATDGIGRFGAAKSMVSVRLPLIVQPALPRFVRPGDNFTAGGIGRVVEGEAGPGSVELQVDGLEVTGEKKLPVSWVLGKPEKVFFPFHVPVDAADKPDKKDEKPSRLKPDETKVMVRLAVKRDTDQAMDAFQLPLPVKRDKTVYREQTFVILEKGKQYKFPEPKGPVRPGTMKQTLLVTPEPGLIKMLAALSYLSRYPHGCLEQRISKLYPELALQGVMKKIGRDIQSEDIKRMMDEVFEQLESCIKPNGLYAYWPGSRGYVNLTAYVVEFLLEAKKLGFKFNPKLLGRGIAALKDSLRSDYSYFINGYRFTERAEALNALAKSGYMDLSYAHDLSARATSMDLYSESKILYSLLIGAKTYKKGIDRLSGDLWKSMIFKLRDGKEAYGGLQYRATGWGGLILASETRTIANVARALYKAEPNNKRVRLLVDELINLGTGDGWGSTNANAAALIMLSEVLGNPQAGQYELEVTFGNDTRKINTQNKVVTRIVDRGIQSGTFKLLSGDQRPLMAMVVLEYVPDGTGDKIKARNEGFVISRQLITYEGDSQPQTRFGVEAGKTITFDMGTVVEEHIQVINSENRYYVAIQAPFAAGFEPMNPNLATSPPEAKPAGKFTRQPDYAIYADDSVTFYFDQLPKGTYDFYYRLRTSVEGSFSHPPAKAELMYHLPTYGNSDGVRIEVKKREEKK